MLDEVPADSTATGSEQSRTTAEGGDGGQRASAEAETWSPPGAAVTAQAEPPGSGLAGPVQPATDTSQLAIAAFVLGLLGFAVITGILGIVLGAVAVGRIRRVPQAGKALAIWGIALGAGWLVVLLLVAGIGAAAGVSINFWTSGAPVSRQVPFTSLVTGSCFDLPSSSPAGRVFFVEETPCNEPHNSQIFATFQASGSPGKYPGVANLTAQGGRGCLARAKESVDSALVNASMRGAWLYPHADGWQAGNRTIDCFLYSPTPISSSVLSP